MNKTHILFLSLFNWYRLVFDRGQDLFFYFFIFKKSFIVLNQCLGLLGSRGCMLSGRKGSVERFELFSYRYRTKIPRNIVIRF